MSAPRESLERILAHAIDQPITYMRDRQAHEELAISRDLAREQEATTLLPPSVQLGERAPRKIRREIDAVKRARAIGADDAEIAWLVERLVAARADIPAAPRHLKAA